MAPRSDQAEAAKPASEIAAFQFDLRSFVFFFAACTLCPFAVYALYCLPSIVAENQQLNPTYPYPKWSDLTLCLLGLVVLASLRLGLQVWLKPFALRLLSPSAKKRKWSDIVLQDRVERWTTVCFKLCYFIFATAFGFKVLLPTNFMPSSLGGSGISTNVWENFPYPPPTPYLKEYYMISLAYHTQSLLFHTFTSHRSDYSEMMLHHICTLFLMLFSYFENFTRIGVLVLIVHDIADIAAYALKASVDTVYTKTTLAFFVALLVTWAYARFYVFPFDVIGSISYAVDLPPKATTSFSWYFLPAMLYILLCLHMYWYFLFLYSGYSYLVTGVTTDHQQTTNEEKLKQAKAAAGAEKENTHSKND